MWKRWCTVKQKISVHWFAKTHQYPQVVTEDQILRQCTLTMCEWDSQSWCLHCSVVSTLTEHL